MSLLTRKTKRSACAIHGIRDIFCRLHRPVYRIDTPFSIVQNDLVATVAFSPEGELVAGDRVTATVTLHGIAAKAGCHSLCLSSPSVSMLVSPEQTQRRVAKGDIMADHYIYSFSMPAENLTDLTLQHSFVKDNTADLYTLTFPAPSEKNGVAAKPRFVNSERVEAGKQVHVVITLEGAALCTGRHFFGLYSLHDKVYPNMDADCAFIDVRAGEQPKADLIFTFDMPAQDVDDLGIMNYFKPSPSEKTSARLPV